MSERDFLKHSLCCCLAAAGLEPSTLGQRDKRSTTVAAICSKELKITA
jgi:hypothetical protein